MLSLFQPVAGRILKKASSVSIDNHIFRLHYKITTGLLLAFSLIVASSQYIGKPIQCAVDEIPPDVMDSYCWIYSTITVKDQLGDRIGLDAAQQGVKPYVPGEEAQRDHKYYQWVGFVFLFQAFLFYVPHFLWKDFEKKRLQTLAGPLKDPFEKDIKSNIKVIVRYFEENKHSHDIYVYQLIVCEVLNFINVVGQILFLDYFLGGEFSSFGLNVFRLIDEENPTKRSDPMAAIFPKVAKCNFKKFGPSGTKQNFDGLCVLPVNIVNEKLFAILWFWLVLLAVITGLQLLYRLATIQSEAFRTYLLKRITSLVKSSKIDKVSKNCYLGDWYLIYKLGENIAPITYKKVINELAKAWGVSGKELHKAPIEWDLERDREVPEWSKER